MKPPKPQIVNDNRVVSQRTRSIKKTLSIEERTSDAMIMMTALTLRKLPVISAEEVGIDTAITQTKINSTNSISALLNDSFMSVGRVNPKQTSVGTVTERR